MSGVSRVRGWSRRAMVAAALLVWVLGGLVAAASQTVQPASGLHAHAPHCAPSTDKGDPAAPQQHHHCSSCLLCSFRDGVSVIASGEPKLVFERRVYARALWTAPDRLAPPRRYLNTQQARAPPIFS